MYLCDLYLPLHKYADLFPVAGHATLTHWQHLLLFAALIGFLDIHIEILMHIAQDRQNIVQTIEGYVRWRWRSNKEESRNFLEVLEIDFLGTLEHYLIEHLSLL